MDPNDTHNTSEEESLQGLFNYSYEIESSPEDPFYEIEEGENEKLSLMHEEDRDILMHRDAHFSGNFDIMLEYYLQDKKGAVLHFAEKRIEFLRNKEKVLKKNLAPLLLRGPDAEKVAQAKKMYKELGTIASSKNQNIGVQIARFILSDDEEMEEEIQKVVFFGKTAIPYLLQILNTPVFYDSLFPGYGEMPKYAALALGFLKAKEAIPSLFALLKNEDYVFSEDAEFALRQIGEKAKEFLLKVLKSTPISEENERACLALIHFDDPEVSTTCLKILTSCLEQKSLSHAFLSYLVYACERLPQEKRKEFEELSQKASLPHDIYDEMANILKIWKKQ